MMLNILVVDDDSGVRIFIKRILEKKFLCKVLEAENGLDALTILKDTNPILMFLDITMPVMDGFEVLEAVRSDDKYKNLPVVILTAVSDKETVKNIVKYGITDYILKPLVYETTYERIKLILNKLKLNLAKPGENLQSFARKKILIVDHDESFRSLFVALLKDNFDVFEADSGMAGLKIMLDNTPDIVCMGENLPLLNEKLLLQKIADSEIRQKMSIYLYVSDIEAAKNDDLKHIEGVLGKTFNPDTLLYQFKSIILKKEP